MLVLTATDELQGTSPCDDAFAMEGELVTPVVVDCPDERCGCGRGFTGLASGRATTTATVVDLPGVSESDLREAIFVSLDRGGWIDLLEQDDGADETDTADVDASIEEIIDEHVENIQAVCARYAVGTVVIRQGALVFARAHPSAA